MTKKKKETTEEEPVVATLDTIKTIFTRALENPARGVPALIGPPQWGKTHYMRQWLLEAGVDHIVMVNPQTDLPEDIAGWPVRSKGELTFTNPPLIPPGHLKRNAPPWALAVDELDKAQDATLSALLTLLNPGERRLRETYIPPKVPICVAMNEPARDLPEPLVARLLFIPFPPAGFEMAPRVANSTALAPPEVRIPQRPFAPGSYFKLKEWFSVPEFATDEAVRNCVISGLFPAKAVPGVLGSLQDNWNPSHEWAESCSVEEFLTMVYVVLGGARSIEDRSEILQKLAKRVEADDSSEFASAYAYALAVRGEDVKEVKGVKDEVDLDDLKARGLRAAKEFPSWVAKQKEEGDEG